MAVEATGEPERPSVPARRIASVFVSAVSATLFLATLAFARKYAVGVPLWDDYYDTVQVVSGSTPVTLEWLWAQHSEHRIPLAKLSLYALLRWFSYGDFHFPAWVNALALGLLSAGLIVAAKRARGWI